MLFFRFFISKVSAISNPSMKSLGRLFCRYSRLALVKSVPSSSSNMFVRSRPDGVRHIPFGFSKKTFS